MEVSTYNKVIKLFDNYLGRYVYLLICVQASVVEVSVLQGIIENLFC